MFYGDDFVLSPESDEEVVDYFSICKAMEKRGQKINIGKMKILVLDKEFDSAITIRNTIVKSVVVGSVLTLRCLHQLSSNCMLCTIEHEKANTCSVDECPVLSGILRQNYPEISRYLNKAAATLDRTAFPHRLLYLQYCTGSRTSQPRRHLPHWAPAK